jgi:hypothetical protein
MSEREGAPENPVPAEVAADEGIDQQEEPSVDRSPDESEEGGGPPSSAESP